MAELKTLQNLFEEDRQLGTIETVSDGGRRFAAGDALIRHSRHVADRTALLSV
jgi:hypothetical protein